jgi:hypothetical protein
LTIKHNHPNRKTAQASDRTGNSALDATNSQIMQALAIRADGSERNKF